jgi:hypothetical protein
MAREASGSTFAGWSGGCAGTGVCTLILGADARVTAIFTEQPVDDPVVEICNGMDDDLDGIVDENLPQPGTMQAIWQCAPDGTVVMAGCVAGWIDTNGDPADGCETNVNTNENCGAVGVVVPQSGHLNATWACVGGQVVLFGCIGGWGDVNHFDGDGCEVFVTDRDVQGNSQESAILLGAFATCDDSIIRSFGGPNGGTIDGPNDHDWYRVQPIVNSPSCQKDFGSTFSSSGTPIAYDVITDTQQVLDQTTGFARSAGLFGFYQSFVLIHVHAFGGTGSACTPGPSTSSNIPLGGPGP